MVPIPYDLFGHVTWLGARYSDQGSEGKGWSYQPHSYRGSKTSGMLLGACRTKVSAGMYLAHFANPAARPCGRCSSSNLFPILFACHVAKGLSALSQVDRS